MVRFAKLLITLTVLSAEPITVRNFHAVDDRVFRGGQPSEKEFEELSKLSVKTVIDLRAGVDRSEKSIVERLGIRYIHEPMSAIAEPSSQQIGKILNLLETEPGPVYVHCLRGKDRTGTVIACYRIAHHKWENQKALDEAKSFGMSMLEWRMQQFIRQFKPAPKNQ